MNEGWLSRGRILAFVGLALLLVLGVSLLVAVQSRPDTPEGSGGESAVTVDKKEWAGKTADRWGTLVYFPLDEAGDPLASETIARDHRAPDAGEVEPAGVVFQRTALAGERVPVPFSTSDGPTGFDGVIPTGFSRSGAGAALAAGHWIAGAYGGGDVDDFLSDVQIGMKAAERAAVRDASKNGIKPVEGLSEDVLAQMERLPAPEAYRVEAWDGDYARIRLYFKIHSEQTTFYLVPNLDVRWDSGQWRPDFTEATETLHMMEIQPGAVRWTK